MWNVLYNRTSVVISNMTWTYNYDGRISLIMICSGNRNFSLKSVSLKHCASFFREVPHNKLKLCVCEMQRSTYTWGTNCLRILGACLFMCASKASTLWFVYVLLKHLIKRERKQKDRAGSWCNIGRCFPLNSNGRTTTK